MMECTTGLTDDEFDELLAWLREEGVEGYPPILVLSGSLTATLMYLRQNIVQAVIGEILVFSTSSRTILPFGPVPTRRDRSTPCCSASLRATGVALGLFSLEPGTGLS